VIRWAKWEGDTLVVDVTGFNDETWLEWPGYFHTNKMHVIERLRREGNVLHYQVTVEIRSADAAWVMDERVMRLNTAPMVQVEDPPCVETDGCEHVHEGAGITIGIRDQGSGTGIGDRGSGPASAGPSCFSKAPFEKSPLAVVRHERKRTLVAIRGFLQRYRAAAASRPVPREAGDSHRVPPRAVRRSMSASAAAGPSTIATATARFSDTTGDGCSRSSTS
jgi:hypothetical protein